MGRHHRIVGWIVAALIAVGLTAGRAAAQEGPDKVMRVYAGVPGVDYLPHTAWPQSADKPVGFDPAVAEAVAERLGLRVQYVTPPRGLGEGDPRVQMLTQGHADVVALNFTDTEARRLHVRFSDPYHTDGLGLMVAADSEVAGPDDLAGQRVIAMAYTTAYRWAKKNLPESRIVSGWKNPDYTAHGLIKEGRVAAYAQERSHLVRLAATHEGLKVLDGRLTDEPIALAVQKSEDLFEKRINAVLEEMRADGTLEALRAKWFDRLEETAGDLLKGEAEADAPEAPEDGAGTDENRDDDQPSGGDAATGE